MALSEIDRNLLSRCLSRQPKAWEDFVDRFMGLVLHVIDHSVASRSIRLAVHDREDLASEVFLTFVKSDFTVLPRFRGESSLATYLTVITRRVVVHRLIHGRRMPFQESAGGAARRCCIRHSSLLRRTNTIRRNW